MQRRRRIPLAAIHEIGVFGKSAGVDHAVVVRSQGPARRFAQVIESGPAEFAGHERIIPRQAPGVARADAHAGVVVGGAILRAGFRKHFLGCQVRHGPFRRLGLLFRVAIPGKGTVFAARGQRMRNLGGDENTLGEAPVVRFVLKNRSAAAVVAGHVEGLGEAALVADFYAVAATGDKSGRLLGMDLRDHFAGQRGAFRLAALLHFVADAPQNHARVVAVPFEEIRQVAPPPLLEIAGIAVGAFPPFVERLVHDEKAHAVAQIQQDRRWRIVRSANGVAAHVLEYAQPALDDAVRDRRADAAGVVVLAYAAHFFRLAVASETAVGIEREPAESDGCIQMVDRRAVVRKDLAQGVEVRRIGRPKRGALDGHALIEYSRFAGRDRQLRFRFAGCPSVRIHQHRAQRYGPRRAGAVVDFGAGAQRGALGADFGRRGVEAPVGDPRFVRGGQPDVAVNARSGVPARIGMIRIVHSHGENVFAFRAQERSQLVFEAHVAVRPLAQMAAVDPDIGVHVNAVEFDENAAIRPSRIEAELLAIPSDARGEESAFCPGGRVLIHSALDSPVVRQIQAPPGRIVVIQALRAWRFAQLETPALVERGANSGQKVGHRSLLPGFHFARNGAMISLACEHWIDIAKNLRSWKNRRCRPPGRRCA
ncbi:MAG: hypothetical protein BWZ10_00916 [candidate division BRC1 bacterium ADurb.BinA364]|nr:MAG: hypothetical protein BWZ10_00916 [candidate division BRC1 bacterium ADurb.BinA364]